MQGLDRRRPAALDQPESHAAAEEASRTLAAAFSADPTVRWICQDRRTGYDTRVRALYNALVAFQIARSHPRLGDTETPRNVSLYERFGYRVTRKSAIGPLTSWWMFREMA